MNGVYIVVGFFVGVFWFYNGFVKLKQKRLIENTPTSKVRSVAIGNVEVYGSATPEYKDIKAPFTKKSCVYYRTTIEEYKSSGRSSKWVILNVNENQSPFYIQDDTGKILINPKNAEIDIPADYTYESETGKEPTEKIKKYLSEKNISFKGLFGLNKKIKVTEYIIAKGDKIYVMVLQQAIQKKSIPIKGAII